LPISGNAFFRAAALANIWQRLPDIGGERRELAIVANAPNPMPRIGGRCQSPESTAMDWQALPRRKIHRQELAVAAAGKDSILRIGDLRRKAASPAAIRILSPFFFLCGPFLVEA
jgi:hypothetical protein